MMFEDLQVAWKTLDDEPVFTINHDAMRTLVGQKTRRINRYVDRFEWAMISVALMTSLILPIDAWREGGGWHEYVVAAVCAAFGIAAIVSRARRQRFEVRFDNSLKGILEESVAQIDRHLGSLARWYWGFHLPIAIIAVVGLSTQSNTSSLLIWTGVAVVTAMSYWGIKQDAKQKRAEKAELSQLLGKLNAAPDGSRE